MIITNAREENVAGGVVMALIEKIAAICGCDTAPRLEDCENWTPDTLEECARSLGEVYDFYSFVVIETEEG